MANKKKKEKNSKTKRKLLSKSGKKYNFQTRKSIHISMLIETHKNFKIETWKKGLSMQETLEECAVLIAQNDPFMMNMLDLLLERKKTGERELAITDAESIYNLIESDDIDIE